MTSGQPVRIPAGGAATITVTMPPAYRTLENITFELSEPPEGISVRDVAVAPTAMQVGGRFVLQTDAAKMKPGTRGNLIVTISGERVPNPHAANANAQPQVRRRVQVGTLPAIAFEITEPQR